MLISQLPKKLRELAEKRYVEFPGWREINPTVDSFDYSKTPEKRDFWEKVNKGEWPSEYDDTPEKQVEKTVTMDEIKDFHPGEDEKTGREINIHIKCEFIKDTAIFDMDINATSHGAADEINRYEILGILQRAVGNYLTEMQEESSEYAV